MPATRRRITAVATLALIVLVVAATDSPAATHAQRRCAHAGVTLAANAKARVYQTHRKAGDYREPRTYGCWRATGRRQRLDLRCDPDDGSPQGDDACRDDPADVALRGRWCALEFGSFYAGEGGETYTSIVRGNLKRGRHKDVSYLPNDSDGEIAPYLIRLYVSRHGGIAYSADNVVESMGDPDVSVIGYVPPPGRGIDRWLDKGKDVKSASLRVHRKRRLITWRAGGKRKHARWR